MFRFVCQRLVSNLIALWAIVTITFLLMHAIPGGPFAREKQLPPAILKNIEARYRLDDPLPKQYADYLVNLIRWDLGPSFKYKSRTVNEIINDGFPVSATLGAVAVGLSLLVGVPAGILSALRRYRWQDSASMALATLGMSVPNFVLASLLMYVLAYKLRWLPAARWGTVSQAIMPSIALAAFPTAFIARLMRSSMLEVIGKDYIRTARAKGLPGLIVIYRHALKNAMIPVVTYLGPLIAAVFTGVFVIEHIFAIPGLGKYYVLSIYNRDYTVILGVTVFYSILLITMNFLVDVAYVFLDPRISFIDKKG